VITKIIFIPAQSGGYYVDRSKATVVTRGGYGRLEFDLSDAEIAALEQGDLEVWGDEADLVFPGVPLDWVSHIKSLPFMQSIPFTDPLWSYWCKVDGNNKVVESW